MILKPIVFFAATSAVFSLLGLLLRTRKPSRIDADRQEHPWLVRRDWASGEITEGARARAVTAWSLAIFWCLVSSPVIFLMPRAIAQKGYASLWLLIFPAAGIGMLVWAARRTLQWKIYGESRFKMASPSGQIGGTLEGAIRIDRPLPPMQTVKIKLTCINRTRDNDNSRFDKIIWSDEQSVVSDGTAAVPVAFYIPDDCRATDDSNSRDQIIWSLSAGAPGIGVHYSADFEVPVFKVQQTSAQIAEAKEVRERRQHQIDVFELPAETRFRISPAAEGGTEIYFPAFRNPGAAFAVAGFFALWTAIFVILLRAHAPRIFPVAWVFFELILFIWMVALWIGTTRAVVSAEDITVSKGLLGIPLRTCQVAAEQISDVRAGVGSTTGSTGYSLIQIRYNGGRILQFGDGIRSSIEAQSLADQISQLLGIRKAPERAITASA